MNIAAILGLACAIGSLACVIFAICCAVQARKSVERIERIRGGRR